MAKEAFQNAGPTFTVNYYHPGKADPVAQMDHISLYGDSCAGNPLTREWVAAAGAALLADTDALSVEAAQKVNRIEVESPHLAATVPAGCVNVRVRAAGYAFDEIMAGDTSPSLRRTIQELNQHWVTCPSV